MFRKVCLLLLCFVCARVYATPTKFQNLLEIHKGLKEDLALYIEKEEKKLSFVKRNLDIFKREHQIAMSDIPGYLGNPINAFTLIKRLTSDVQHLRNHVRIQKANLKRPGLNYPSKVDLLRAAESLVKVLAIYDLNLKELVEGRLNGSSYSIPMTSGDCFELAQILLKQPNNDNLRYARDFLVEAYNKYNEDGLFYPFTEVDILEQICLASSKMEDIEGALHWTKILLQKDPEHSNAMQVIAHYQKILSSKTQTDHNLRVNTDEEKENCGPLKTIYKTLCRGKTNIPEDISKRFSCCYSNKNHPFLKIAPFKMEMMYLNPDVVLFHDVVTDDEIEEIMEKTHRKLKNTLQHSSVSKKAAKSYNEKQNVFLSRTESDTIARILRRIKYMTGLNDDTEKGLDVTKYVFEENHAPRYDFESQNADKNATDKSNSSRIGVVMLFMSNVDLGGATVFPALGLSVLPVKGGALYWLNSHASGELDYATLHAECPIVQGSKWGIGLAFRGFVSHPNPSIFSLAGTINNNTSSVGQPCI